MAFMSASSRPSIKRFAVLAALLILVTGAIGAVATASDPEEGTLSIESPQLTWTGEASKGTVAYPEPRPECEIEVTTVCDRYTLNVDVDPAHWESHAGGAEVLISWSDREDDFDLYVYKGTEPVGESANSDTTSERV